MTPYAEMLMNYLPAECRPAFAFECREYGKDPLLALLLQMFGGLFGVADFYLGNIARGVLMAIGTISGIGVVITVPVWLYRCCVVWFDTEADNDAVAYALAYRYLAAGTFRGPEPPPPPIRPRPNITGVPMVRAQQ
jgi:TM2 domain-containing membrane protein YozV